MNIKTALLEYIEVGKSRIFVPQTTGDFMAPRDLIRSAEQLYDNLVANGYLIRDNAPLEKALDDFDVACRGYIIVGSEEHENILDIFRKLHEDMK